MKTKLLLTAGLLAIVCALPGFGTTLGVTATATPAGSLLYQYNYTFSVAGGTIDTLFLGSDDLSPLDLVIDVDGSVASNWSWLGNSTSQNFLEFFSTDGSTLGSSDTLQVSFESAFLPERDKFAVAENSSTDVVSNELTGVLAPTTTPEPASIGMMLAGLSVAGLLLRKRRSA